MHSGFDKAMALAKVNNETLADEDISFLGVININGASWVEMKSKLLCINKI